MSVCVCVGVEWKSGVERCLKSYYIPNSAAGWFIYVCITTCIGRLSVYLNVLSCLKGGTYGQLINVLRGFPRDSWIFYGVYLSLVCEQARMS